VPTIDNVLVRPCPYNNSKIIRGEIENDNERERIVCVSRERDRVHVAAKD
jgi:hypothetical protein